MALISGGYKIPNLTQLIKAKNGGDTGRKKQLQNTATVLKLPIVEDIFLDQMKIFDPVEYLQELINEKFQAELIISLYLKNDSCRIFYARTI